MQCKCGWRRCAHLRSVASRIDQSRSQSGDVLEPRSPAQLRHESCWSIPASPHSIFSTSHCSFNLPSILPVSCHASAVDFRLLSPGERTGKVPLNPVASPELFSNHHPRVRNLLPSPNLPLLRNRVRPDFLLVFEAVSLSKIQHSAGRFSKPLDQHVKNLHLQRHICLKNHGVCATAPFETRRVVPSC